MRRLLTVQLALVTLLLAAPAARAQDPPPAGPKPPAAAEPAPVQATMQVVLQKVGHVGRAVARTNRRFRVRGLVYPYVEGQRVRVRLLRGKRILRSKRVALRPIGNGNGRFVADLKTRFTGRMRVGVTHRRTAAMGYLHERLGPVELIHDHARYGERSHTVAVLQRLLADSGYVVGRRGVLDDRTARAVLAFRKLSGLSRTTLLSPVVVRRILAGGGQFVVRHRNHGRHAEADLTHQVLALIDHGRVERIYPISSGKPSTPTVLGTFRVYRQTPGTNSLGMVHSSYFIRGYAIHGYAEVPTYPASHGCLRTPVPDAWSIYRWLSVGDIVDVYYRTPGHRSPKPSRHAGP